MKPFIATWTPLAPLLLTGAFGCTNAATNTGNTEAAESSCKVKGTKIDPSLLVTDPTVLANFGFARTVGQVLSSSGASSSETTKQLYQQWMSTYGTSDCSNPNVDPDHYGEVCPRTNEALLDGVDPTDPKSKVQFLPVALANRFDLAASDGTGTCGEYRIIYAMSSTDPQIGGRGFYIFEAALPNPTPGDVTGCLGVAEFWQGLSAVTDETTLATDLTNFYYNGGVVPDVGPVVAAANYGLASDGSGYGPGQIRANMFINDFQWNLREFKTDLTCVESGTGSAGDVCTLTIDHVSVKNNPALQLFEGSASLSSEFLADFPANVKTLASSNNATIGMVTVDDLFNTYESVEQPPEDVDVEYDLATDSSLTTAITNKLSKLKITDLDTTQILRRATTQTCAGCHQVSTFGNESNIGSGSNVWPASDGFVQINEQSQPSVALTGTFLPHRKQVLDQFIDDNCGGGSDQDEAVAGMTLGGVPVGSPN